MCFAATILIPVHIIDKVICFYQAAYLLPLVIFAAYTISKFGGISERVCYSIPGNNPNIGKRSVFWRYRMKLILGFRADVNRQRLLQNRVSQRHVVLRKRRLDYIYIFVPGGCGSILPFDRPAPSRRYASIIPENGRSFKLFPNIYLR